MKALNPSKDQYDLLVVDDNSENLQLLVGLLREHGYNVRAALSGELALRGVTQQLPDLILLDIKMPGMDGFEVCAELKRRPEIRDIPVIFISVLEDLREKVRGFEVGGVDYITKPFQAVEVLARVRTHLELASARRSLKEERNRLDERVHERTKDLVNSDARFRSLVEQSTDWIWEINAQDIYTYVGPNIQELLGYPAETILGKTPFELMSADEAQRISEVFSKIVAAQQPFRNLVNRLIHNDGHDVIMETSGNPVFDEQGCLSGYLGVDRDITERYQYQEVLEQRVQKRTVELTKSKDRLKQAQKIAHLGQWELDLANDRLEWSEEVYRIFEVDPDRFETTYEAFLEAIHPEDREMVNLAYTESLKTGKPYNVVHRLRMKDGRIKYVREICHTEFDERGTPLCSIGAAQDITPMKEKEEVLQHNLETLERFKKMAVGREKRMISLKEEINSLLIQLGKEKKYRTVR